MIMSLSIGTTIQQVFYTPKGKKALVSIQNLSANNVYILNSSNQGTSDGIKLVTGAAATNNDLREDLWLIADGATSDVRISYSFEAV